MNINLDGNGVKFNKLNDQIGSFQIYSSDEESYSVYIGDGLPDQNVNLWIKKTGAEKFSDLVKELKNDFIIYPNLEYVGVDNFSNLKTAPQMCFVMSRQNLLMTFQDPDDLEIFISNFLGLPENA